MNVIAGFLQEPFQRFRAWIDNENYVIPLFRQKSRSDEFAEKIENEIEKVMEKEKFCYKDGKTVIPAEYVVFISTRDSTDWYGVKRDFLRQKLEKYVERRLQMLSLETFNKNIIHLQGTGEVETGEVRVVHRWAEGEGPIDVWFSTDLPFSLGQEELEGLLEERIQESHSQDFECETVVKPNLKRFFCLEVRRGAEVHTIPVFQPKVTLGRASTADICLEGDLEISRHHVVLSWENGGNFNITATGRNPVVVQKNSVFPGQRTNCRVGDHVEIGSYSLTIKD